MKRRGFLTFLGVSPAIAKVKEIEKPKEDPLKIDMSKGKLEAIQTPVVNSFPVYSYAPYPFIGTYCVFSPKNIKPLK